MVRMADRVKQGVMLMKRVLFWAAIAIAFAALLFKDDHYDAIRHEFYQVWDTIDEMRAEE